MQIGFRTACLRGEPLRDLLPWAAANGFGALEVDAGLDRPNLDAAELDRSRAASIRDEMRRAKISLSALAFYANMLDPDAGARERNRRHMEKVVAAAALLDADCVCCFVGRDPGRSLDENLELFSSIFGGFVRLAADAGVRLAVENCPGWGWFGEGVIGNLAVAPAIWRRMFQLQPGLGLCFDPSHLAWMGVDYLRAAREFAPRIHHIHAKDVEIDDAVLRDCGILLRAPTWYRYRLPGRGEIKWAPLLGVLRGSGYRGALSLELEDLDFRDAPERVREGLLIGKRFLDEQLAATPTPPDGRD